MDIVEKSYRQFGQIIDDRKRCFAHRIAKGQIVNCIAQRHSRNMFSSGKMRNSVRMLSDTTQNEIIFSKLFVAYSCAVDMSCHCQVLAATNGGLTKFVHHIYVVCSTRTVQHE